jgi:membrane protein required for colicin V production
VNIIDSILLLLLSLFGLRGYFKGFFRETFSLLGLVLGFAASLRYDDFLAEIVAAYHTLPAPVVKPLSFISLFVLVYLSFAFVGWLLHRFARFLLFHGVDRAGGCLVGAGKGIAVLALTLFLLNAFPLMPRSIVHKIRDSYLAPPLVHAAGGILKTQKENISFLNVGQNRKVEPTGSL